MEEERLISEASGEMPASDAPEDAEEEREIPDTFITVNSEALAHPASGDVTPASRPSINNEGLASSKIGFEARTSHDASEVLLQNRSKNFARTAPVADRSIWKRAPPDFRPQCFAPKPPKRNSRDAMKPWMYSSASDGRYEYYLSQRKENVILPQIVAPRPEVADSFETRFNIDGPLEAKMWFSREGSYKPGPYLMPKPHDFRGYTSISYLGLPEFSTSYEHDPFNLNFKSKRLNTIHGLTSVPPTNRNVSGRQMAPPRTPEPQWDARLILPKDSWPTRSGAYTRYRPMNRNPHSALMERVTDTLSARWAKEKLERQLMNGRSCTLA